MHDLFPRWVKAGQLGGPRREIIFLTFPTTGARALGSEARSPRLRDEGGFGVMGWNRVTLEPRRL